MKMKNKISKFILYKGEKKNVSIEVYLKDKNIWLSQKLMGDLFGVQRPAITKHLNNIFQTGELDKKSVSSVLEHTIIDKKNWEIKNE